MATSTRAPLANLPNATNSPLRTNASAAIKRTRNDVKTVFEDVYAPPSKRQHLGHDLENIPPHPQTSQKRKAVSSLDTRLGQYDTQAQAVERECANRQLHTKGKAKEASVEAVRRDRQRAAQSQLDDISRWQRYYEKQFPRFVFFFDNVPEDARRQCSKEVRELGAREDRFFSKNVTHVITTRSIPENSSIIPIEDQHPNGQGNGHSGTINPSLLDRRTRVLDELAGPSKSRSIFDTSLTKKPATTGSPEKLIVKAAIHKVDVLQKAKDLEIKIWQLEKLQRILRVMYAEAEESTESPDHDARYQVATRAAKPSNQASNLSQLIKNEELSKAGSKDLGSMLQTELIPLTEPYIFVRCMNEKTKPIMVRQFQKVIDSRDGSWPQFRPVTQGKCPFIIEEPRKGEAEKAEEQARQSAKVEQRIITGRTQATAVEQPREHKNTSRYFDRDNQLLQPYDGLGAAPLAPVDQQRRQRGRTGQDTPAAVDDDQEDLDETEEDADLQPEDATVDAPQITATEFGFVRPTLAHIHSRQTSMDMKAPPAPLPQPNPKIGMPGGEPLASGIQKSAMTSAIRSQTGISSTSAAPGNKSGTSRELRSLQRRVLERNSTGESGSALSTNASFIPPNGAAMATKNTTNLAQSRRMADVAGRVRAENPRAAKTKAQEKINMHGYMAHEEQVRASIGRGGNRERVAAECKQDAKQGYCENCREKFNDFEEHTLSRKHRKFATTKENWVDLDNLLAYLQRPLKKKRDDIEDRPITIVVD